MKRPLTGSAEDLRDHLDEFARPTSSALPPMLSYHHGNQDNAPPFGQILRFNDSCANVEDLNMKIGIATIGIVASAMTIPAIADPWKDESGHGRWIERHEYRERYQPRQHYRVHDRVYRLERGHRPRPAYRSAATVHEQWCYSQYRSYRAWDNTYQPYNGQRRECISPY